MLLDRMKAFITSSIKTTAGSSTSQQESIATNIAHKVRSTRPLAAFGPLLGFVLLLVGYLYVSQLRENNSDSASLILEGQAMLHGNIFLHGWYLPPDSYITIEMPLDALGSLFLTGKQLLKFTPAFLYAATVIGAVYFAIRCLPNQTTRTRWLAAGSCLALIAFPIGLLLLMVMQTPVHIGTIVASLIAWWAYDHFVKYPASCGAPSLFVLVTTLAIIGDPLAELLIVAPVGIVSAWILWRTRGRDMISRFLLGGALLALVLGIGLRQVLISSGTYIGSVTPGLVSPDQIWPHIQWIMMGILLLFHINPGQGVGLPQWILFLVLNGVFLLVGIVGFVLLFRRTLFPKERNGSLTSVLSWAIVSNIGTFLVTSFASNPLGLRYLLPAFIYLGILSYQAFDKALAWMEAQRYLTWTVLAFLTISGLTFGVTIAETPRPPIAASSLVTFLENHNLSYGFGSYWAANIITLESNEQVHVLPVDAQNGHIHSYYWQADAAWFQGGQVNTARFVVIDNHVAVTSFQAALDASFGAPDHIYHLSGYPNYVIFTWDHPISGLSTLNSRHLPH